MMNEWRPINSAPKNGKIIVLAQEILPEKLPENFKIQEVKLLEPVIGITSYHEDAGFCICEIRQTTHWLPLPKIPRMFFDHQKKFNSTNEEPYDYNTIIPEIDLLRRKNHTLMTFLEKIKQEIDNNIKND